MGFFNFNKKKKFLSKLSSDQRDEITITLILMKQMIDADGVDKPEEKEYFKKYLINCGISSKEELESILDRAGNLTSYQYDTIVQDFDEFQKLTILQELYGIICSDNEINHDEVVLLFRISRDMGIDDDIVVDTFGANKDLFEKYIDSNKISDSISEKFEKKTETKQEDIQTINKDADSNLDFNDVRVLVKQLKGRKNTFKIRSLWENYCDYQLLKENSIYEQSNRGFFSKEIVSWTGGDFSHSFENNFDPKKLVFTGQISIIEEKKIQSKEIIDSIFLYIKECENPEDNYDIKYDYSFNDFKDWYFFGLEDDYIGWLSDEIYIIKPSDQLNFSLEKDFNLNLDRYSDIVSFSSCEMNIRSHEHTILISEPKNEIKNLKWVKDENIQDTIDNKESKFSFNKVQALKEIELNWIKGISPIYSVSLTELFKHPGRTLCRYITDEESDFYEGEHISLKVKSISEGKDLIDFIINQNGENVSFLSIDNDRIIHKLGYLFDISLVEPEGFDFPIIEINRRKKLEYISGTGEEILHGIHLKSDSIKTKIKGFKKLILNNGELVADGRYTSDSDAQKIDSWHSDFSTAFDDVNQVLETNDPTNEFLKLNIEEAKNKIIDSGFSYNAENFEMNFYKGNSSWWVNFNLNKF